MERKGFVPLQSHTNTKYFVHTTKRCVIFFVLFQLWVPISYKVERDFIIMSFAKLGQNPYRSITKANT